VSSNDNFTRTDLRAARRAGSRRTMLIAGLRLIEKGHYRPTPQEVADEARMHRRSFYAIFGDLDAYLEELLAEYEASIHAAITEAVRGDKSLSRIVLLGR
jgi:AcrR family transcriptional regulator